VRYRREDIGRLRALSVALRRAASVSRPVAQHQPSLLLVRNMNTTLHGNNLLSLFLVVVFVILFLFHFLLSSGSISPVIYLFLDRFICLHCSTRSTTVFIIALGLYILRRAYIGHRRRNRGTGGGTPPNFQLTGALLL